MLTTWKESFYNNLWHAESRDLDLTGHVPILEDAVAHMAVSNPSGILTIESRLDGKKIQKIWVDDH